jgi:6-pyruvoyltetrahydropterin/6-carboxytetrahydropterin synthase
MRMMKQPILLIILVILLLSCSTIFASNGNGGGGTFSLGIRDSFMIAHSFHDHPAFGPAGGMHGATYTVDVEFITGGRSALQETVNWVIDIGLASSLLAQVLQKYHLKNLDTIFCNGEFTTTEFMCRQIHQDLCQLLLQQQQQQQQQKGGDEKDNGLAAVSACCFHGELCVKLWESHKAWASYRAPTITSAMTTSITKESL